MTQTPSNPYSRKLLFRTSIPRMQIMENWPSLYNISHPIYISMDVQRFYLLVWANNWPYELLLASLHWNSEAAPSHWTIISSIAAIWKKHPPSFMNLFIMYFRKNSHFTPTNFYGPPHLHVMFLTAKLFASTIVRPMPPDIDNVLPGILLEIIQTSSSISPNFLAHIDTCASMNTGNLLLHQWIITTYPECVAEYTHFDDNNN